MRLLNAFLRQVYYYPEEALAELDSQSHTRQRVGLLSPFS